MLRKFFDRAMTDAKNGAYAENTTPRNLNKAASPLVQTSGLRRSIVHRGRSRRSAM